MILRTAVTITAALVAASVLMSVSATLIRSVFMFRSNTDSTHAISKTYCRLAVLGVAIVRLKRGLDSRCVSTIRLVTPWNPFSECWVDT
jgi:hypothetical protein